MGRHLELPRPKPAVAPMPVPAPIRISGAWPRPGWNPGLRRRNTMTVGPGSSALSWPEHRPTGAWRVGWSALLHFRHVGVLNLSPNDDHAANRRSRGTARGRCSGAECTLDCSDPAYSADSRHCRRVRRRFGPESAAADPEGDGPDAAGEPASLWKNGPAFTYLAMVTASRGVRRCARLQERVRTEGIHVARFCDTITIPAFRVPRKSSVGG